MQTRLPRALAALGVALLLSSIEAEGKNAFTSSMESETAEFKKGKKNLLLLLLGLFSRHISGAFSSSEKRLPSEVCPFLNFQVQFLHSASPSLYNAIWSPCACLCSVLSTLPPTLPPSLRISSLDRATAVSSSVKRISDVWAPGTSEYGHPYRISSWSPGSGL